MIRVFGITGTNGKTTASWMLRNILQQKAECGLIGTVGHYTGRNEYVPENTTPGKQRLKTLFDEMEACGTCQCVMEVSSHGIHQGRVADVDFSGTGFTNLSRDHLDYHGNMEEYYQVKKRLFMNDAPKAISVDDDYGRRLYEELPEDDEKISYSLVDKDAGYYGMIRLESMAGTAMDVYRKKHKMGTLHIRQPGKHFAQDALLAAVMAKQQGISFVDIKNGLQKADCIPGRMEFVGDINDTLGIVDYAHTPDSLRKLMEAVRPMKRGRVLCVFGCGGCRDKGKRCEMGMIAGTFSDYCIITNDNPRCEPPENIAQAIEEGVYLSGCDYTVILDRYQAIKRAVSLAGKWDIIVVAGKGHETVQLSGNECIPFSDKKILKELLEKKYEKTYDERDCFRNRR